MAKLALKHFHKTDPKHSNRVWQSAYFNAPKNLSHEQKMQLADNALKAAEAEKA